MAYKTIALFKKMRAFYPAVGIKLLELIELIKHHHFVIASILDGKKQTQTQKERKPF